MLNNEQLYEAQASGGEMVCTESWKDNTLCKMKTDIIDESFVNETDIEDVMSKIKNNDGRFVVFENNNIWIMKNTQTFLYRIDYKATLI